jgi:membrane protease YdiL (CAAX protease family)
MSELIEQEFDLSHTDGPEAESGLIPAEWPDLVIYILGGIGLYFLASVFLGYFIQEISLTVTILISVLNFLILSGSVYLLGIRRKKLSWKVLGLDSTGNLKRHALIGAGLAVAILPIRIVAGFLGILVEKLATGEISSLTMREDLFLTGMDTWYGILLMIFGVGILVPIAEELFFRGLLYDFFRQKLGWKWAVGITSILFGLAHFDSLAVIGSSFVMAVLMAISVERTRSLWMTIFMHITTNAGAVLALGLQLALQNLLTSYGIL